MDAAAASTVDSLVQAAMLPQQTQAAVGTAVLSSTMDVAQQLSASLLSALGTPATDPSLGSMVDTYA